MTPRDGTMYYEFNLDHMLQTWVDGYEEDRAAYWNSKLVAEEWSPYKQLMEDADEIAASIRKRAMSLQNIDDFSKINDIYQAYQAEVEAAIQSAKDSYEKLEAIIKERNMPKEQADECLQLFKELQEKDETRNFNPEDAEEESDRPLHLIWERLCIDDAWEFTSTMRDRIRRIFLLDRLIDDVLGHTQAPQLCIEFLALVSRCYIYGFVPECLTMCRSAMESAFRDKVSDDDCLRAGQRSTRHGYTLGARIEAAFDPRNNLLSNKGNLTRSARKVRTSGDTAVHKDPSVGTDAIGIIRATLKVIDALSSLSTPTDN